MIKRLLALLTLLLFGLPSLAQGPIAVTHVTVIDATGAKPMPDQVVLIVSERITKVGKSGQVALPEGTQIVDGTGKFLIPGLWDMHVHGTGIPHFGELYVVNGVTGIRDMFSQSMSYIQATRKAVEGSKAVGPRIVAAGRIVDGPQPIWPGSVAVHNADEGRKAVTTVKKEGSDFVKVYSLLPRDAYFAIAEEAKKQNMVFAGHVPNSVSALEASNVGQKSIEHLTGVLKACSAREVDLMHPDLTIPTAQRNTFETTTLLETYDPAKAQKLFSQFKSNHTWQCPTLVVLHNIAYLNDKQVNEDARVKYMPSYAIATWNPKNDFRFKSLPPTYWTNAQKLYRKDQEIVRTMRKAGVEFLAGTDTMNPYCFPGFSLHDELAYLVEAGLTPMEALQAATLNPARYLEREKDLGTIEPGKLADIVLLDANPLENIHNTTKIRVLIG